MKGPSTLLQAQSSHLDRSTISMSLLALNRVVVISWVHTLPFW